MNRKAIDATVGSGGDGFNYRAVAVAIDDGAIPIGLVSACVFQAVNKDVFSAVIYVLYVGAGIHYDAIRIAGGIDGSLYLGEVSAAILLYNPGGGT